MTADQDKVTRRHESLVWRSCSEQLHTQIERFVGLDTKAGILVGFVAAALAEIIGALIIVSAEHPAWFARLGIGITMLTFAPGIISIILVAYFAVRALRPQELSMGSDLENLLNDLNATKDPEHEITKFEAGYAAEMALLEARKKNEASLRQKAKWVGRCAICVGMAVIVLALSALLIIGEAVVYTPPTESTGEAQKSPPGFPNREGIESVPRFIGPRTKSTAPLTNAISPAPVTTGQKPASKKTE
jgi:hypothetical protein